MKNKEMKVLRKSREDNENPRLKIPSKFAKRKYGESQSRGSDEKDQRWRKRQNEANNSKDPDRGLERREPKMEDEECESWQENLPQLHSVGDTKTPRTFWACS